MRKGCWWYTSQLASCDTKDTEGRQEGSQLPSPPPPLPRPSQTTLDCRAPNYEILALRWRGMVWGVVREKWINRSPSLKQRWVVGASKDIFLLSVFFLPAFSSTGNCS